MDFIQQIKWRPEIGDPNFMGWLTVAAYAVAAFTAGLAAHRAGPAPGWAAGGRGMWFLISVLMTFLCVNKQLDLQSLFTDIGRAIARIQGWYAKRREFQKWFVLGLLATSFIITAVVAIKFRRFWRSHFLLGAGLAFLLTFIVVRAVSFHHVDVFLRSRLLGVKMNWFLELTGISLIWLAALRDYRNPRCAPTAAGPEAQ